MCELPIYTSVYNLLGWTEVCMLLPSVLFSLSYCPCWYSIVLLYVLSTWLSGRISFIYFLINAVCLRGWKDGCNFAVGKERLQSTTDRVQRTEYRVQLPCGVQTPCKGIIYIAKGNALDRVHLPSGIKYTWKVGTHGSCVRIQQTFRQKHKRIKEQQVSCNFRFRKNIRNNIAVNSRIF